MCGAPLEVSGSETVATCEYCGTRQTLPRLDDDRRANLYDRANHFRRNNDYDKAAGIYEQILSEDRTDAEAYWSLVLCKYGIEYVEDPASHKRIPTVNRAQYTSIFADEDYKSALQYADGAQREVYEQEARTIDGIQKGILEISRKEEPFDVFICYKETDDSGRRTPDSVLANDLYHQLTQEGFKVFFSRITLEDKLGTAYEPYIFAALNSAKVMVVLGTRPEYFNAVWVRNEWSRYLALIKGGAEKTLIPAYRDMDPYDLPEEFSHLQAQDMSRLGFVQDLVRGIKKIVHADEPKSAPVQGAVPAGGESTAPLLRRAFMFLENRNWGDADAYCERVLDREPENAEAYLGKLMAELHVSRREDLRSCEEPFDTRNSCRMALKFADAALASELREDNRFIRERNENARLEALYSKALATMHWAGKEETYNEAAAAFSEIAGYKDADEKRQECLRLAEGCRRDNIYSRASALLNSAASVADCEQAIEIFQSISGWKDSDEKVDACRQKIEELKAKAEADRLERERQAEIDRREAAERAKRNRKIAVIAAAVLLVAVSAAVVVTVIIPGQRYKKAEQLLAAEDYDGAIEAFAALGNYKDAVSKLETAEHEKELLELEQKYGEAEELLAAGDYDGAIEAFTALGDYNDSASKAKEAKYEKADSLYAAEDYEEAISIFAGLGDYRDAAERMNEARNVVNYNAADALDKSGSAAEAAIAFGELGDYSDARKRSLDLWNTCAQRNTLCCGAFHTVALKSDGTVVAAGSNWHGQCDVSGWTDIVAVAAGVFYTVGLRSDGTMVAAGYNMHGECSISDWTDIVAVAAYSYHTVGLRFDGTVVATGSNEYGQCDVSGWTDIVAVVAGENHTIGLRSDGTVVATGSNRYGQCDVSGWTDIVAVAAGDRHTIGLRSDGTVVAAGDNEYGQCDVSAWTDIVAVAAGSAHTVGLRSDGTVVAAGYNKYGQCDVSGWTDIIAVAVDNAHTVGLRSGGTVVAAGYNSDGQCDVSGWTGIKLPG